VQRVHAPERSAEQARERVLQRFPSLVHTFFAREPSVSFKGEIGRILQGGGERWTLPCVGPVAHPCPELRA
jgi:hypothetical protein